MDTISNTDFTSFLDFCKSLDSSHVQSPEQALKLYRTRSKAKNGSSASRTSNLGSDLMRLREQIVAAGAPLLNEEELEEEVAARRGERRDEV